MVNAADLNAFALPGGYIYVNRGLIKAARNEGELAGVLAHEMAHVAQRHGTSQVSKAYGAQLGLGLLSGVLGGRDNRLGMAEQIVGSLGLNALFMKFSRNAENEADRVGARMMASAGYDPMGMASFFDLLASRQGGGGGVPGFLSSHPSPRNRSANIRAQAAQLGGDGRTAQVGGLQNVQARLDRMPRRAGSPRSACRGCAGDNLPSRPASPPGRVSPLHKTSCSGGTPERCGSYLLFVRPQIAARVEDDMQRRRILYGLVGSSVLLGLFAARPMAAAFQEGGGLGGQFRGHMGRWGGHAAKPRAMKEHA